MMLWIAMVLRGYGPGDISLFGKLISKLFLFGCVYAGVFDFPYG